MSATAVIGLILVAVLVGVAVIWLLSQLWQPTEREQIEMQRRTALTRNRWAEHQAEARMNAITDDALRQMADIAGRQRGGGWP